MKTNPKPPGPTTAGNALVVTLVLALVLCLGLSALMHALMNEYRLTHRSWHYGEAINLAEAAVEEGVAMMNHGAGDWSANGWTQQGSNYLKSVSAFTPNGSTAILGAYHVVISNAGSASPVITGTGFVTNQLLNSVLARSVTVTLRSRGMFQWGLLAKERIDMNGNNLMLDSFDSSDPAYSNYDYSKGYGTYDFAKRKDNGDAATNSGITNSIAIGNADIYGHVATGPGGSVSIGPNGFVGSLAYHPNGVIQPDRISHSMNVDLPPPVFPFSSGVNLGTINSALTVNGGAGSPVNYVCNGISLSGNGQILTFANGYSRLLVNGNISITGKGGIVVNSGSRAEIYVTGSVNIAGNGVANANGNAITFQVYKQGAQSTSISGNGQLVGLVYAPDSDVSFNGGGSSGSVVGAIVGRTITLNGHVDFHYDEALKHNGPTRGWSIVAWKEN